MYDLTGAARAIVQKVEISVRLHETRYERGQ